MSTFATMAPLLLALLSPAPAEPSPSIQAGEPVRVVATLPAYGNVVRMIGGDQVSVLSIANPNEDAHFVRPKPSFALELRRADLFITTGLDLELWVPALLDRAGNAEVMEGGRGYVTAYSGIELLDIPASADRSQGDIHIYGNPHLHTDPIRMIQVARNITTGLQRVAPDRSAVWSDGLATFIDRIHRATFGDELVEMLGGEALGQLALSGNLQSFLERDFEGAPLADRLGGWLGRVRPYRGRTVICYHKNWAYFEERFGITCADYVEAKPGIPPTPRHVARLIALMRDEGIGVVFAANYFDRNKVEQVAERGGGVPVIVPIYPSEGTRAPDYFALVDRWIADLTAALGPPTD